MEMEIAAAFLKAHRTAVATVSSVWWAFWEDWWPRWQFGSKGKIIVHHFGSDRTFDWIATFMVFNCKSFWSTH